MAAVQKTPNFGIQIAMCRWGAADLQIVGKKLILGAKSPHMDLEIHRMSGADALGRGQNLRDADGIGVFRNLAQVAQLVFQQLHQGQPGHAA